MSACLGSLACIGNNAGGAAEASVSSGLRDGDIIFHTSTSRQGPCLQRIMGSRYTHMGLILFDGPTPYVWEAVGPVRRTGFAEWTGRGVGGRYVVKRLKGAGTLLTPAALERMRGVGPRFEGKPYDPYFQWSDERIYCSELVWKIYDEALGLEIGARQRVADFDFSDDACTELLRERFPGGVCDAGGTAADCIDLDEPAISPAAMFESGLLEEVLRN